MEIFGISFDEFWKKGIVKFDTPKKADSYVRHNSFFKNPIKNKLHTTSGKIELYCEDFNKMKYSTISSIPKYFEPYEFLGNAKEGELHVISPHPYMRLHSQMANANVKNVDNIKSRQHILINIKDAKSRKIKDKDLIEVYNKRGSLIGGAKISEDIMEGVIAIEEGSWLQLDYKGRCNNASVNILTSTKACSDLSQATSANSTLAYMKKCTDAEPNTAFHPPKTAIIKYSIIVKALNLKDTLKNKSSQSQMEEGEKIFYRSCSVCHAPQDPKNFTKTQWKGILKGMLPRAGINTQEREYLLDYINRNAKKN